MYTLYILLNKLTKIDRTFFMILGILIAAALLMYFVIMPLINHKFYKEQRDNLRKREKSFKRNSAPQPAPRRIVEEPTE